MLDNHMLNVLYKKINFLEKSFVGYSMGVVLVLC